MGRILKKVLKAIALFIGIVAVLTSIRFAKLLASKSESSPGKTTISAINVSQQTYLQDSTVFTIAQVGTFRYKGAWEKQDPQLKTTLLLMYATDGSLATLNLSAAPTKFKTIGEVSSEYIKNVYGDVYANCDVRSFRKVRLLCGESVVVELTGTMEMPNGRMNMVTRSLMTLHHGKMYSIIMNCPTKNDDSDKINEFNLIVSTFMFSE